MPDSYALDQFANSMGMIYIQNNWCLIVLYGLGSASSCLTCTKASSFTNSTPPPGSTFSTFTLRSSTFIPLISALHSPVPARSHSPHLLPTGKHTVCPSPTSILLIPCHLSFGSHPSSQYLVSSGFFVLCQPQRFVIRCTCTSTPMPSSIPHAADMQRYAILGPTPGRRINPSTVEGISLSCSSRSIAAAALIYLVLLLWKPTLPIRLSRCFG